MTERDDFGPGLRRERERRGISLQAVAEETKIAASLLVALERNDFSRWPGGIFRRSFVRAYAQAVGLDAERLVRQFVRLFPEGERLSDGTPPSMPPTVDRDRRTNDARRESHACDTAQLQASDTLGLFGRLAAAIVDIGVGGAIGIAAAFLLGSRLTWPSVAISLSLMSVATAVFGRTFVGGRLFGQAALGTRLFRGASRQMSAREPAPAAEPRPVVKRRSFDEPHQVARRRPARRGERNRPRP